MNADLQQKLKAALNRLAKWRTMSNPTPWEKAAEQVYELAISGLSRGLHGLPKPSGSFEAIIKAACEEHAAQVLKERDELKARVERMRDALEEVQLHHGVSFSNTTKGEVEAALSDTP